MEKAIFSMQPSFGKQHLTIPQTISDALHIILPEYKNYVATCV